MKLPTFKEQFDKITEAYIKGEIKPLDSQFCFCGTLSPDSHWACQFRQNKYPYSIEEYARMENALLSNTAYFPFTYNLIKMHYEHIETPEYKDQLFLGLCEALEVLKQIHIERGEDVDQSLSLKKRINDSII